MFKPLLALALAATTVAGCGVATPILPVRSSEKAAAQDLHFRPVTIKDLVTMPYDDPKAIGTLVTFEASFGRERWTNHFGVTTDGYKLWDRAGNGIRCFNIVTETTSKGSDAARDLNAGAQWLLNYGTYVKIEGAYRPGFQSSGHAGSTYVEKSIDVYFINGKPVREYVSK